jgi:hypothetical protein
MDRDQAKRWLIKRFGIMVWKRTDSERREIAVNKLIAAYAAR